MVEALRASNVPVVAVVAPAGYGKTTLLRQWADIESRRVAWLSLDRGDNDPDALWAGLTASISRSLGVDASAFGPLDAWGAGRLSSSMPRLVSIVAAAAQPTLIVLDDLQFVRDPDCLEGVSWLLEHLPPDCRLVFSSRTRPALPVARLRTRGALHQVGVAELALSDRETGALILGAGVTLPAARVIEIATDTEGWPTGIYVAALAHTERVDGWPADLRQADDDRLALDFIRAEVLDGLKPNLLRFLTRTAVLDRMSGPLCDAILQSTGSTSRLRTLEASGMFVVALDRERTWYRYHRQFRDALRSELGRIDADAVAEIHRLAADWFEADGQDDAAVDESRASGDPDHLARLIGRLTLRNEGRLGHVGQWLDAFDDEDAMLERSAPVAIFGAFFHAVAGRPETAERWARAAERLHDHGPMPDGSPNGVSWLAVLRAAMVRGGVEAMGADAEVGLALIVRSSPWHARATLLAGVADLLAGRLDQADVHLAEVVEVIRPERVSMTAAAALAERAVVAIGRGDWSAADAHIERSLALITDDHLQDAPIAALTYAIAARLAIRRGDVAAAEPALGRAQRARPLLTYALPWLAVQVRIQLAHAYLALAESSAVRTLLGEVDDIFRHRPEMGLLVDEAAVIGQRVGEQRDGTPGAWTLTTAELRLLPYLPTHLSFREIALRLSVSLNTVKTQAISVYGKLGASSRGGAIARAVEVGLLDRSAATLPGDDTRS